jgi:hypothetical protein
MVLRGVILAGGKVVRRKSPHSPLLDTRTDREKSIWASLSSFQAMQGRVKTQLQSKRKKENRTTSASV